MRQAFFIGALVLILSSCSNGKKLKDFDFVPCDDASLVVEKNCPVKELHFDIDKASCFSASHMSNLRLVKLESRDDIMIGSVSSIGVMEDRYVISDAYKAKKIFVFGRDGIFYNTIGRFGSGPGEYLDISSVNIDGRFVYVTDMHSLKVICYDIDGNLIKEFYRNSDNIPLNINSLSDSVLVGTFYAYNRYSPYAVSYFDANMDFILGTALPFENSIPRTAGYLIKAREGVLFYNEYDDYIYSLEGDCIVPILKMNLFDDSELDSYFSEIKEMDYKQFSAFESDFNNPIVRNVRLFDCDSKWVFEFSKHGVEYIALVDKASALVVSILKKVDYTKPQYYLPLFNYSSSGCRLVSVIDDNILQIGKSDLIAFNELVGPEVADGISKYDFFNSNPIIIEYELK